MNGIHVAVVDNIGEVELERVQAYLPGNYQATQVGSVIVVEGRDYAGWTFLDYVQPRCATGGIFLRDVTPSHSSKDETIVNQLGQIHEELQALLDRLEEIPTDDEHYPYTGSEIQEAQIQLSYAMTAVQQAIYNRQEEYEYHMDRLERGYAT